MTDVLIDGGLPESVADVVYDGGDPSSTPDVVIDGGSPTPYVPPTPPTPVGATDRRRVWLESLDGSVVIPLTDGMDWSLQSNVTGLQLPPIEVIRSQTPGVPGSTNQEVRVDERLIYLPLLFRTQNSQEYFLTQLTQLRGLIWPGSLSLGSAGTFRLCVSSPLGERVMDVVYTDSWTGDFSSDVSGATWEKFGLTLLAVDPFFHPRDYVTRTYTADAGTVFLSDDDAYPWPRSISASVVIGSNMPIVVDGDVPVWVEGIVDGPTTEVDFSFTGTSVQLLTGVPSGSRFSLVTDPRARSARLDGVVAWDRITMGSTMAPLQPGTNLVNVQVGTSGEGTGLTLRWKPGYLSAW